MRWPLNGSTDEAPRTLAGSIPDLNEPVVGKAYLKDALIQHSIVCQCQ